jgi:hypothetical protein
VSVAGSAYGTHYAELSTFADAYLGVSGGRHAVSADYGQVVMRRLMANRRVQAGAFGVIMSVVTFTTRGDVVAALVLGLIAGLAWFALYTWYDRPPR